ncbi:MAG: lysine exporter LysO family protein [Chlorobi bacterium]|nr:lysine exporter LysO family protein [Chlorobiota bacterium]
MITVLILMFGGILIGYFLKNKKKIIRINDRLTMYAIFLLLFLMGVSMGSNKQIMSNLDSIGLHALLISVCAVLGSIIVAYFVGKLFFKGK